MAHFSWLGGPHDCDGERDTARCTVSFGEPEPEPGFMCGTGSRLRVLHEIIIEGSELAHVERFMERVHDDDEVNSLRVTVRAGGTLKFFAAPCIYSAAVGRTDPDWDGED